jgi:GT2 family glycosyltransferase
VRTVVSILEARPLPSEVVVIDQSDRANTAFESTATAVPVRYVHEPGRGASRARNRGAELARCPILAFVDDDVVVRGSWLAALVAPVARDAQSVGSARVLAGGERRNMFVPSTKDDLRPARYRGRVRADVLWTGAMAIARDTFVRVGGFDERFGPGHEFPAAEDNDLGFRLLEAGCLLHYVPGATVEHHGARPLSAYIPLRIAYGRGMGAFYAKHARRHDRETLHRLVADVVRHLFRAARYAFRRPGAQTAGDVAYAAAVVGGALAWWRSPRVSGRDGSSGGT